MGMLALKQLYRMSLGKPRLLSRCKTTASHKPTVAVAMSGGIDSAVTALLLQDQGYNCVGVFMKNWDPSDECGSEACDISVDYKDMQEVCKRLDIPSHEVNFVKEYWNEVFAPFLDSYKTGIETPNPDAFCNRFVKFNHFQKFVKNKLGIDTIATGHYSRMVPAGGTGISAESAVHVSSRHELSSVQGLQGYQMLKGVDPLKDQSYFLALTQGSALQNVLFPIGHLTKAEVKAIAAQRLAGTKILSKAESMGICFIGKRDMRDFLEDYITLTSGRFIDLDTGEVVGVHDGFEYYTIGQKARISGVVHKYYVVGKRKNIINFGGTDNRDSNATVTAQDTMALDSTNLSGDVYVVNDIHHIALNSPYITQPLGAMNWIAGCAPKEMLITLLSDSLLDTSGTVYRCECKEDLGGKHSISSVASGGKQVMMRIAFDTPQRAITPGQIIALYDGDVVLGGGVIAEQPLPEGKWEVAK